MAHQRSGLRFQRTGARRRTSWTIGVGGITSLITGANTLVFGTGAQAAQDGLTLVRTRGEVLLTMTGAARLDGFSQISMGICIVSENAAGIGATAIPAPSTDIGWDGWLWFWTGSMSVETFTAFDATNLRIPIDSKAMRKFKNTDVMVGVIQAGTEVGTASLQATMQTRLLVKLS